MFGGEAQTGGRRLKILNFRSRDRALSLFFVLLGTQINLIIFFFKLPQHTTWEGEGGGGRGKKLPPSPLDGTLVIYCIGHKMVN